MRLTKTRAFISVAGLMALGACGGAGDSSQENSTSVPVSTTVPVEVDELVDADNVLLAVALLEVGDIDAAIAAGIVTPAEVDAARSAISEGTLREIVSDSDGS